MSVGRDNAEVNAVDSNGENGTETICERRAASGSRPLTALRNMTTFYQSAPAASRSRDREETRRAAADNSSTTPHGINDILARSTLRPSSSPTPPPAASRTPQVADVTKSPVGRLASAVGLPAATASPSMYWAAAAAAAASLLSPTLCWNQRGSAYATSLSKHKLLQ